MTHRPLGEIVSEARKAQEASHPSRRLPERKCSCPGCAPKDARIRKTVERIKELAARRDAEAGRIGEPPPERTLHDWMRFPAGGGDW